MPNMNPSVLYVHMVKQSVGEEDNSGVTIMENVKKKNYPRITIAY